MLRGFEDDIREVADRPITLDLALSLEAVNSEK